MSLDLGLQALATAMGTELKILKTSLTNKLDSSSIVDNLSSTDISKPLSANQGRVIKGLIDSINTLLSSNDTSLDQLQEIVTFIKNNKSLLDSLGIANITGLQTALDGKASIGSVTLVSNNLSTLSTNVGATDTNYVTILNTAMA